MKSLNRRQLINRSALAGVAGLFALSSKGSPLNCDLGTPAQVEGPFYPISDQLDKDNDLTFVKNRNQQALGEVIFLSGVVKDQNCNIVPGALVEIWQAGHNGKYSHPGDPNPNPIDPNFQYWGRCLTNQKGEYTFKTILPGEYPATSTWSRPPHIHFKVHLRGFEELTTQMYFAGHSLNVKDRILQSLSLEERRKVIVDFKKENGLKRGSFDIVLQGI